MLLTWREVKAYSSRGAGTEAHQHREAHPSNRMSGAMESLLSRGAASCINALDLSLGGQVSLTLEKDAPSTGIPTRGVGRRISRSRTSFCMSLPIIHEGDETLCEVEDVEPLATRDSMPCGDVNISPEEVVARMFGSGPFNVAVASLMGAEDADDLSYHDDRLSKESDAILQSLRLKLNL